MHDKQDNIAEQEIMAIMVKSTAALRTASGFHAILGDRIATPMIDDALNTLVSDGHLNSVSPGVFMLTEKPYDLDSHDPFKLTLEKVMKEKEKKATTAKTVNTASPVRRKTIKPKAKASPIKAKSKRATTGSTVKSAPNTHVKVKVAPAMVNEEHVGNVGTTKPCPAKATSPARRGRTYTKSGVARGAKALQALLSKPVDKPLTLTDVLLGYKDEINAALAKGHTYKAISAALREAGIRASVPGIKRILATKSAAASNETKTAVDHYNMAA